MFENNHSDEKIENPSQEVSIQVKTDPSYSYEEKRRQEMIAEIKNGSLSIDN